MTFSVYGVSVPTTELENAQLQPSTPHHNAQRSVIATNAGNFEGIVCSSPIIDHRPSLCCCGKSFLAQKGRVDIYVAFSRLLLLLDEPPSWQPWKSLEALYYKSLLI